MLFFFICRVRRATCYSSSSAVLLHLLFLFICRATCSSPSSSVEPRCSSSSCCWATRSSSSCTWPSSLGARTPPSSGPCRPPSFGPRRPSSFCRPLRRRDLATSNVDPQRAVIESRRDASSQSGSVEGHRSRLLTRRSDAMLYPYYIFGGLLLSTSSTSRWFSEPGGLLFPPLVPHASGLGSTDTLGR